MSCDEEVKVEFRRVKSSEKPPKVPGSVRPAEKNGLVSDARFSLDGKLLIDHTQLFVGSKIGEGAHGKVYEGK